MKIGDKVTLQRVGKNIKLHGLLFDVQGTTVTFLARNAKEKMVLTPYLEGTYTDEWGMEWKIIV